MDSIKLLASTAIREALEALLPMFEQSSGRKVALTLHPVTNLVAKVREGIAADVVMTARDSIDILTNEGHLVPDTWTGFVLSRIGVAVRQGAPRPDISTSENLKTAFLAAKSIGISKGPSGGHVMNAMARIGIADVVKAKAVIPDISVRIGTIVANGEAEIGVQQIGELLTMPGIDYVGPLPKDLQAVIAYGAARPANAVDWAGAQTLLKFITAPDKTPLLAKLGLELG